MSNDSATQETVLVTGGTGFLASWVIARLLSKGFRVRTTIRDEANADRVRAAVAEEVGTERAAGVEFAVADLMSDEGWDAAVGGVDYVMHTASPLGTARDQDLIRTARQGTRRILEAADRARVKRVVLTSSGVTAVPADRTKSADTSVWAAPSGDPARAYDDSKILAERDAWAIAAHSGFELVVVLPTFLQGPVLGRPDPNGSSQIIRLLLTGGLPAIPNLGWDVVDVRDVADLHVLAVTTPEAAGQRLLGGSGRFLWWKDMAEILRTSMPEYAKKIPARTMLDLVVRVLAIFNGQMKLMRPRVGRRTNVDTSRTRALVAWEARRTAQETILDTAASLISKGAVG